MAQPEADYEIDFDADEQAILAEARADARARAAEEARQADRELAVVQSRAAKADGAEMAVKEGTVADDGETIEFMERKFRIAEKIGLMPLLKYASASDMSTEDPRALAAVYAMLRDCIHPGTPACGECADCEAGRDTSCKSYDKGDWAAFEEHAIETKAGAEDLLPVISQVMEIISGRPTGPPAPSSAGRRATRRGSTGNSSGARGGASRR
jgi:hypothetical protein